MKIAIVTETFLPSVDGVVTRLRHAVERFQDLGHEVMVIAPRARRHRASRRESGGHPPGDAAVLQAPALHPAPHPTVDGIIRGFHPDVVHAAQPPLLLASSGAYAAHRQRIPLVASYHTHIPPRYLDLYRAWKWGGKPAVWWQIRRNHALADINLATSRTMKAELETQGDREPPCAAPRCRHGRLPPALRQRGDARAPHPGGIPRISSSCSSGDSQRRRRSSGCGP